MLALTQPFLSIMKLPELSPELNLALLVGFCSFLLWLALILIFRLWGSHHNPH